MDCNPSGIDLHIHSTASDGTLSPAEILKLAETLQIGAIAITDHDTLKGSCELLEFAGVSSVQVISGIEISTSPPPSYTVGGSFHVLGYGIRVDDPVLNLNLEELQHARENRNPFIIERLNAMGLNISLDEVVQASGEAQIGRPHIAQVLVNKGMVGSIDEAFDRYLGFNKPAYIEKFKLACHQAIEMISNAGGVSVLAHPYLLGIPDASIMKSLIAVLKEMGLQGIEVYYPDHSPENIALYLELARDFDLVVTGGTDFHGAIKPDVQLGYGKGDFFVPYSVYEKLMHRHQAMI